jgi:hypothetical protein
MLWHDRDVLMASSHLDSRDVGIGRDHGAVALIAVESLRTLARSTCG